MGRKKKETAKPETVQELPGSSSWPHERKCPECGKVFSFLLTEQWTYWDGHTQLCSWGCMRKREKRREEEQARIAANRRNLTPRQREAMVRRLVLRGATDQEIQETLGMTRQHVNYYRRKIEDEDHRR